LLLDRHAPVDVVDTTYHGTPLSWALFGWSNPPYGTARDRYYDVVERLVRAGAAVKPQWSGDHPGDTPFAKMLRADMRMLAALRGDQS
jgi:hypothetical protein